MYDNIATITGASWCCYRTPLSWFWRTMTSWYSRTSEAERQCKIIRIWDWWTISAWSHLRTCMMNMHIIWLGNFLMTLSTNENCSSTTYIRQSSVVVLVLVVRRETEMEHSSMYIRLLDLYLLSYVGFYPILNMQKIMN